MAVMPGYIGIEFLKPSLRGNGSTRGRTLFFSLNTSSLEKTGFVFDLPLTHYESRNYDWFGFESYGEKNDAIGNPYLGIQTPMVRGESFYELGVRLPFASQRESKGMPLIVGLFTDFDRMEAFFPKCWTVQCAVNYNPKNATGLSGRLRLAPNLLFYSGKEEPLDGDQNSEFFVHYSAQVWYNTNGFGVGAGITGIAAVTEKDFVADNGIFSHQLSLAIDYGAGRIRPGLIIRMPLDGRLDGIINSVIGFSFQVGLKPNH
jgi:hypothetical protein